MEKSVPRGLDEHHVVQVKNNLRLQIRRSPSISKFEGCADQINLGRIDIRNRSPPTYIRYEK